MMFFSHPDVICIVGLKLCVFLLGCFFLFVGVMV